jgi:TonB family protein
MQRSLGSSALFLASMTAIGMISVSGDARASGAAQATTTQAEPAEGTTPPVLTKQTKPKYPQAAFDKRIEGDVVVEFVVDVQGRVSKPRVVQSVAGLDEAAIDCVRQWRFKPALKKGKPVEALLRAPVQFRIS